MIERGPSAPAADEIVLAEKRIPASPNCSKSQPGLPRGKLEQEPMNLTIEIPDDSAARFQKQAQARGLTVDRWLIELGEQNARAEKSPKRSLAEVFAKVRGLADDLDFRRDPSPGRDVAL